MGDMAEVFREMTKYQKEKRRNRLIANTEKLKAANVNFESKNNGVHIIINHNGKIIDFYPSTGLFWDRKNPKNKKRGIDKLLKYIKE